MDGKSPIVPIIAGAGGSAIAMLTADKLGMNPNVAAWGTAAVGAATALGTKGVIRQIATGVGAAGVCLGALQLFSSAKMEKAKKEAQAQQQKRQADGDLVTRTELNDALTRMAEQQKQGQCDLVTSLRDEVKKVVVETMRPQLPPATVSDRRLWAAPRAAAGDEDYARNAYGAEDERNAEIDDGRNAAIEDEYTRNAYGDEYERNAFVDDERNAFAEEERNAFGDEYERNAYGDDERNARVIPFPMRPTGQRVTYAQPVNPRVVDGGGVPAGGDFGGESYPVDDGSGYPDAYSPDAGFERNDSGEPV
jgi:hypothetical protein